MDPLFPEIPEDFAALSDEDLTAWIDAASAAVEKVHAAPSEHVSDAYKASDLIADMSETVEALEAARAALATRGETPDEPEEPEEPAEPEPTDEELAAQVAELAGRAAPSESEPAPAAVEPEPVVAAVEPPADPPAPLPRPSVARRMVERPDEQTPMKALTAAAGATKLRLGQEFHSPLEIATAMEEARRMTGRVGEGTSEKVVIARAEWGDDYPADRRLDGDFLGNEEKIRAATDMAAIQREMARRKNEAAKGNLDALTASGGLCAPVTPYYNLMMISEADRPVRGALPGFNADRGGIRYARPAALAAITTEGVDIRTAAEDKQGGTIGAKSCQVVSCPDFEETDVQIIYHCLEFGNLGARTFPERVAQWNSLTLAAQARLAESELLTGIDAFSTQVTAGHLGLGASATLFSQILAAANGMRNRHRMDPEAVLRLMLPYWAVDLIVSDVIRSQFQRFDTDAARVQALLASFNIAVTLYIDGANGRGQVFGAQSAGGLLPFPSTVVWYLFPEGSFLFVDGGMLELGIVRDSVLNKSNAFQIFGESFENVAFVGVESLAVATTVCDSGTVSLPTAVTCPISYAHTS